MIDLRARPLRATQADASYWVQRPSDLGALASALSYGFNTMVLGARGSGKTSLLNFAAARFEDEGWHVGQLSAGRFETAAQALSAVVDVMVDAPAAPAQSAGGDRLQGAYDALAQLAAVLPERSVILLDGLAPVLVHEIFGRMRDEMWALGLQWVLTGDVEQKAVLLAPPADAFFEQVITLAPFTEREVCEMLTQRDPDGELDEQVRLLVAERSAGNPGRALILARQALVSLDPLAALQRGSVIEEIEHQIGEPAARLADELARNGPSGPADEQLLRRMGWSRPRAYQVFQALDQAGFTEVSTERTGRAGRPVKTYRLKGLA